MELGSKIRKLRIAKNIPAKQIADYLNMSLGGYSKIERNEVEVNISKLEKVAEALEMTPEDILSYDETLVFNILGNNNQGCNNHNPVFHNNSFSQELKQLYEDKIKLLEEKIAWLEKK